MEYRLCFDTIPEQFDKWRIHYSPELFEHIIAKTGIGRGTKVLELGPGTGQATEPILATGCDYTAIELGENFAEMLRRKYGGRENFSLINDDFITHDFGGAKFDFIYSAATIQWIPEDIAFSKTFELLESGGMLAMMYLHGDYQTPDPALFADIQKVYDAYFKPPTNYKGGFVYDNAVNYGFTGLETKYFKGRREYTADEYIQYIGTHSDHIMLEEPYRTPFFEGVYKAVMSHGGKVVYDDTYILKTVRKP
ncbi:class I SAM-dependent methyltransferase [Ruminococcus albus]|uniref:Methyltransferase domain-containing protein n=1 Tax=Ruminococcus albus TaxID=1264 RepID=A0A1H7IXG7_RUMAL|nr:rRNA adenine N-6-methyltransferase family protein [Ruminococcus albus]SEK66360.1 Methyltransferase domain-containing protein [Ruminococcus albus]